MNVHNPINHVLIPNIYIILFHRYWRCLRHRSGNCPAALQTGVEFDYDVTPTIESGPTAHNHEPDSAKIVRAKAVHAMRHIIKAAPTQPVKCAYDSVASEKPSSATPIDDAVRILLPAFDSVNTILKRQRASTLPKLPKSQADLILSDEWEQDNSGQRFLLRTNGDKSNEMLLFVTDTNLERLSRCKTIYMDGTFKTCPGLYSQFFSIHGLINEH